MSSSFVFSAMLVCVLAAVVYAPPTSSGSITNGQGSVTVAGLSFNPCVSQQFGFAASVTSGLSTTTPNTNVKILITWTYQANDATQVYIPAGVPMSMQLMSGAAVAAPAIPVVFTGTNGGAVSTANAEFGNTGYFDQIWFTQATPTGTCDPALGTAPGKQGFTPVNLQFTLSVGTAANNANNGAGQVIVYDGKLQDGFQTFPWGQSTFTYEAAQISWKPCDQNGLTWYNTVKKYNSDSLTGIQLLIRGTQSMTLQLRLHNVGVAKDVFVTLINVQLTKDFVTLTIPVTGLSNGVYFDQILVTETQGTKCSQADIPMVYVTRVTMIGLADLSTNYINSLNGVAQNPASGSTPGKSGAGTKNAGSMPSPTEIGMFTSVGLHLLALVVLAFVV